MKLEDVGFYTLSDKRAQNISLTSDLQRCELILTNRCNFNCPYCRGIVKNMQGDLTLDRAKHIVDIWTNNNLHNIRFSGGEPTLWKDLLELVQYTKSKPSIQHIALSTNGNSDTKLYDELLQAGVNDFSISLDACCASTAAMMSGGSARFDKIIYNIKHLAELTYVTVGIVVDEKTQSDLTKVIEFANSLGVADIRFIPSAQWNNRIAIDVPESIRENNPILNFRLRNIEKGRHIRGLTEHDSCQCWMVLDDMAILNNFHFPCIIYMREQGDPIGTVDEKSIEEIRTERRAWMMKTNCHDDAICKKNCLDVCRMFNVKAGDYVQGL
jgi:molybdenum cofactor biosynthesis enzyme MoaA